MEAMRQKLEVLLSCCDADDFRESDALRTNTRDAVNEMLKKFSI